MLLRPPVLVMGLLLSLPWAHPTQATHSESFNQLSARQEGNSFASEIWRIGNTGGHFYNHPNNPGGSDDTDFILKYKGTKPGKQIKPGTKLRILPVGDSITVGFLSATDGGDGNGYRKQMRDDIFSKSYSYFRYERTRKQYTDCDCFAEKDEVVFAGTESTSDGTMNDGYFVSFVA